MLERPPSPSRGARLWFAAVAVIACGLLGAAPSALAVPAKFWGVVPQGTPTVEQLQRLKRGGVDSIRVPISWASAQPAQEGAFDWSSADAFIVAAVAAGIEPLPFLSTAPSWAVPVDRRFGAPAFLPVRSGTQRAGWTRFVREAVLRYGPGGGFWAGHPGLPVRPVRTWQVWNEPNFKYFVARPNPAEYGRLVKLTSSTIKAADRGAQVILGGLFSRPIEATFRKRPPQAYFAADFLDQMYESNPGIKSKFQGVALHPYTGSWKNLPARIEEVRSVLKVHGDIRKGLWMTEMTWSSERPQANNSFAKGLQGQARELRGAFRLFRDNQRRWRVQRIYWFSINDYAGLCNFCGGSGLFGEGFQPKPAWRAYVGFAGGVAG
ncbi:MAG TPA: glycosyl hydrolase [Solirubrobacterales bacterium]|nr:glycosyl hydrolase [Solirubrobacterales bacterium]